MRMRALMIPFLSVALVAGGCGGSSGAATLGPDDLGASSRATADALVEQHGDEGGFAALVLAFERGYDVAQIVAAAPDGRVQADGTILDAAGEIEEPAGDRLGLILIPTEGEAFVAILAAGAFQSGGPVGPGELLTTLETLLQTRFELADDIGVGIIALIVDLAENGYSFEQIVEGIVLGALPEQVKGINSCVMLFDPGPTPIFPADAATFDRRCPGIRDQLTGDDDDTTTTTSETTSSSDETPPSPAEAFLMRIPEGETIGELDRTDVSFIDPVSEFASLRREGDFISWDSLVVWDWGDPSFCTTRISQQMLADGDLEDSTIAFAPGIQIAVPGIYAETREGVAGDQCHTVNLNPVQNDSAIHLRIDDVEGDRLRVCGGNYCWWFDLEG